MNNKCAEKTARRASSGFSVQYPCLSGAVQNRSFGSECAYCNILESHINKVNLGEVILGVLFLMQLQSIAEVMDSTPDFAPQPQNLRYPASAGAGDDSAHEGSRHRPAEILINLKTAPNARHDRRGDQRIGCIHPDGETDHQKLGQPSFRLPGAVTTFRPCQQSCDKSLDIRAELCSSFVHDINPARLPVQRWLWR